jgi:hypothetical protein
VAGRNFDDDEILTDFRRLTRKICREKNLELKELEKEVGASPGAFSQIRPTTEKHWRMFKKLVLDVYPLAIFDQPLNGDQLWRYLSLLIHTKVEEWDRHPAWQRVHEIIEEEYAKAQKRNLGDKDAGGDGRRRPRKSKAPR